MNKKLLIILLIPSFAFADIGSDLNNIFNQFFGSGQEPTSSFNPVPTKTVITKPIDIPDIEISEDPTEEDLSEIRKQIFLEEASLDDFNERIEKEELELWQISNQQNTIKTQLTQLDSQIGINAKRIDHYRVLETKWKAVLDDVTKKKSEIKAEIRIRQRSYEKFMSQNFIRNEHFGASEDVSIVKWLFSQKKVSQILEEKQLHRHQQAKKKVQLEKLKALNKKLSFEETQSAFLFGRISKLHQKIAQEKINLEDFADGKVRLLTVLNQSQYTLDQSIQNYSHQKNEAAIYLQNLHYTLKKTSGQVKTNYEEPYSSESIKIKPIDYFFLSPLKIPLKVTAFFHDPQYKKKLGRTHNAVDFFAPQGTDLFAPADGIIKKIGLNNYGYSYLIIEHEKDFYTIYGHLSSIKVNKDQHIKQGELIGQTGGTPGTKGAGYFTTGPHLHFEVFQNGNYLDPLNYLPKISNS